MWRIVTALFLLSLLVGQSYARGADCKTVACGLVVRGEVTGLEVERGKNSVIFHVSADFQFVNEGTEPVILFDPAYGESFGPGGKYWLGGWALHQTEEDANKGKSVFDGGYWESVSGSEKWRAISKSLDVKTPPDGYTRILQPGEVWKTSDVFRIYFEAEKNYSIPEHRTWKEMQEFSPRMWLRVSFELLPSNVGYFKPNLIRKLKKRWAAYGNIPVEDGDDAYNFFIITSEPMQIDFSQAKVKEPATESGQ